MRKFANIFVAIVDVVSVTVLITFARFTGCNERHCTWPVEH
jgi:hypothetical protein